MFPDAITIWGGLLVALLLAAAFTFLWLIDNRLPKRMLHVAFHLPKLPSKLWLPVLLSIVAAAFALTGCLMLSVPCRLFWPLFVVLLSCLVKSTPSAMTAFLRSLKHTEAHRRYLLACGATHLESLLPSVRRSLRAALLPLLWQRSSATPFAMLLLLCGLLLGGYAIAAALAVVLMTWAAAIVASVLSAVFSLWLADRLLFDQYEQPTAGPADKS